MSKGQNETERAMPVNAHSYSRMPGRPIPPDAPRELSTDELTVRPPSPHAPTLEAVILDAEPLDRVTLGRAASQRDRVTPRPGPAVPTRGSAAPEPGWVGPRGGWGAHRRRSRSALLVLGLATTVALAALGGGLLASVRDFEPTTAVEVVEAPAAVPADSGGAAVSAATEVLADPLTAFPAPSAARPNPTPGGLSPADRLAAARAALGAGDWQRALKDLESLQGSNPDLPGLAEALGAARLEAARDALGRGDFAGAAGLFERVRAGRPSAAQAAEAEAGEREARLAGHYAAAEAAWGKDDETVLRELEAAYAIDPAYRDVREKLYAALISRANAQVAAGDRDGARASLTRAVEVDPTRGEAPSMLASLLTESVAGEPKAESSSGPRVSPGDLDRILRERQRRR